MSTQHRRLSSLEIKQQKETDVRRVSAYILAGFVLAILTCFVYAGLSSTALKPQTYLQIIKDSTLSIFSETSRFRDMIPMSRTSGPMRIYMYELPNEWDRDIRTAWYQDEWLNRTSEYNSDLWVHNFIANSPYRTMNPEEATLFYIPIYPTRRLHLNLHTQSWQESIEVSVNYSKTAFSYIRETHPYWNRHRGRDHFTTLTGDHARCLHFTSLTKQDFGEMFTLQHLGDLVLSNHSPDVPRHRDGEKAVWPCYRPGWDILLPAFLPDYEIPTTGVFAQQRDITALYRFDVWAATAQREYHNVNVRKSLKMMYDSTPLPGANWEVSSLNDTLHDMSRSIFCITPPGMVAHTSRYWRSILRGCIPVSYYRAYELAFQDLLDYDSFTVNMSPYNVLDTHNQLATRLHDEKKLHDRQRALAAVQDKLNWKTGVPELLTATLKKRSEELQLWSKVHMYETKVWGERR